MTAYHSLRLHCDATDSAGDLCLGSISSTRDETREQARSEAAFQGWRVITYRNGRRFDVCALHAEESPRIYGDPRDTVVPVGGTIVQVTCGGCGIVFPMSLGQYNSRMDRSSTGKLYHSRGCYYDTAPRHTHQFGRNM